MKTTIEFINHASVLISTDKIGILSDPWFSGDAFNKGWNLIYENSQEEIFAVLKKTTHIWLSHEHPDHFSIQFFKNHAKFINENGIKILFQITPDKRVIGFLESLAIECHELPFNEPFFINDESSVICIKDGFYDSSLLVQHLNEKILNLNDCEIKSEKRAQEVAAITGKVDVLLTQFSFAAWKGGKENLSWRKDAAQEKLKTIELQARYFEPELIIPFASFIFFSNEENFYLNDAANTPEDIIDHFGDSSFEVIIMKPGDVIGNTRINNLNKEAIDFWKEKYQSLNHRSLNKYHSSNMKELAQSFEKYCTRIKKNNNLLFIKILRALSPIPLFKPIIIQLTDINISIEVDYLCKNLKQTEKEPMLFMHSESALFMFNNSFGFDTLTVNGCFEENNGGFITATKTLAIENLNNIGFSISPKLFFNIKLIQLFLKRLSLVKKKIRS